MIPVSEKLIFMLNGQVAHELRNEIIYRQIAAWAHTQSLSGLTGYFSKQADGEREHAGWVMDILKDANAPLAVPAIVPSAIPETCEKIAQTYVTTEAETTDALEAISHQADAEYNIGVQDLMQRMLREQTEEEGSADAFSRLVKLSSGNLILLDLALR